METLETESCSTKSGKKPNWQNGSFPPSPSDKTHSHFPPIVFDSCWWQKSTYTHTHTKTYPNKTFEYGCIIQIQLKESLQHVKLLEFWCHFYFLCRTVITFAYCWLTISWTDTHTPEIRRSPPICILLLQLFTTLKVFQLLHISLSKKTVLIAPLSKQFEIHSSLFVLPHTSKGFQSLFSPAAATFFSEFFTPSSNPIRSAASLECDCGKLSEFSGPSPTNFLW